jgi:alpha-methylacyl-CoA racemase
MVEGAALLATMFTGMRAAGHWNDTRGDNALDSGAPWYDTYATRDGKYVAVGAIEPKFYAELLHRLGLVASELPTQHDRAGWPVLRQRLATAFRARTRDEWCEKFADSDACVAPVLDFSEARAHPHANARNGYVRVADIAQPAPAPRFSRTPGAVRAPPPERGSGGGEALLDWGFSAEDIDRMRTLGLGFSA